MGTLDSPKSIAGLTAFKNFFNATQAQGDGDPRRDEPVPVHGVLAGPRGRDLRPGLVQLLHRERSTRRHGAVRDAEPHGGQADAGLPRRLRPRGARCRAATRRRRSSGSTTSPSTANEKALQAKGNIPNATNLLGNSVNERAAARSWFVPQAKHWVDVENGNILQTMLAQILTGKLTVKQAATVASENIAQTLNES